MKGKILYIEDNEQNLYLITYLLKSMDYEVIQARSGEEGLACASACVPDLILLDIQLPGMDGYEIARRLREIPMVQQTPIVAVTSYAMVGDREKALAAGCDGYIEKPIDPVTFVARMESHLLQQRDSGGGT